MNIISKILSKTLLVALATMLVCSFHTQAAELQTITITGTVVDDTGETLPGVSIHVRGTTSGTTTNANGGYTISVPNRDAVLVFSFLGFNTEEIAVGSQNVINVTMISSAATIDEVVITALGMTRDMRALGYAITSIGGDEIIRSSVVNPINALQGKVAGVQINMGAAGPQSSQRILIRGNTSLSPNNQPIFIVDGIIVDNENTKTGGWEDRDFGNSLKNLNSDDFESVTILKGAAATALYGSRASNGVILITTKKGKKGEGLGVSFSHTQQWENIYRFPDFQNEFGPGTNSVWGLNPDGTENRTASGRSFGAPFDGLPYTMSSATGDYEGIWQAYPDNVREMYQTGRFINTNLAVSGGTDRSTFRFSYSNMNSTGLSLNNNFVRNNFSLNATHDISNMLTAHGGFTYMQSEGKNPTFQGDRFSPVYDFSYSIPRVYNAAYWRQNYMNEAGNAPNPADPFGMTTRFFMYFENNEIEREENYRGFLNLRFNFTDWLSLTVGGDMNRAYITREDKAAAVWNANTSVFGSGRYMLRNSQRLQYRGNAMLTASHQVSDFSFSASIGAERYHQDQSWNRSTTDGGLRVYGVYELNNSVNPATTEAYARIDQKRINSIYGFINTDWRRQVYLDITGRNDWSSTLMYSDGTGNVSYFYPSFSLSWLLTESFQGQLPSFISFAKLRGSYAIVGNDCAPYLLTNPGTFVYQGTYGDPRFGTGQHAYFQYVNRNLGALDLQPEKQHAIEFGLDFRMFSNRLGIDLAWYKTNTRNQILTLSVPSETGVDNRIINAGDIQNSGVELLVTGVLYRNSDWLVEASFNYTLNRNKIVDLYTGVDTYRLRSGSDIEAWATVGGAYGDLYTNYAYRRDDNGQKLLNQAGMWLRSGDWVQVGNSLPKFLGGFATNVQWKSLSFHAVLDSRFGGQIWSGSHNYGMSSGVMKSSLTGRNQQYGGLQRTLADGRVVYDGMIPDGVFQPGSSRDGVDISGMTYQQAYDAGHLTPLSASVYYSNLYNWGDGIREAAVVDISWVAVRELALHWEVPRQWTQNFFVQGASLGLVVRNVGYLYNSLPDNIHPEGLRSNHSAEFQESGGNVYSRTYGFKINLNF